MKVPVSDLYVIEQYLEPFVDAIMTTPAIKGHRFHALTKEVGEEQKMGLFGMKQRQ